MNDDNASTCGSCRHWSQISATWGACHHSPPTATRRPDLDEGEPPATYGPIGAWPLTRADDQCGQHGAR